MEKFLKIKSKSGYTIEAKIFLPDSEKEYKEIIIACHGFGGDKESSAIYMLAEKMNKSNIPVICFDWPGHGKSEVEADKLEIQNCISDLESIEEYLKETYNNIKVGVFATSFGAYITLLKIAERGDEYFSVVLRAPAICMKDIYLNAILKKDLKEYKARGFVKVGYDREMTVLYDFYEDLNRNDLFKKYNSKRDMFIVQGTEDDMAPIADTIKFIQEKNSNIKLYKIIGADHRMKKDGELETAIEESTKYILNCIN